MIASDSEILAAGHEMGAQPFVFSTIIRDAPQSQRARSDNREHALQTLTVALNCLPPQVEP